MRRRASVCWPPFPRVTPRFTIAESVSGFSDPRARSYPSSTRRRSFADGNPGLRRAVGEVWPRMAVQRCCVHKLRNLERKAPKYALAEIRDDFHGIVYAANADAARAAYAAF